jgi:hypothetical protein
MDGRTGGRGATAVELRPGRRDDAEVCGRICYEAFSGIADTHGFPSDFASLQVGISGYASDLRFTGHAVGGSDADIEALILAADAFHGSGILVPITNGELFRWCLEHGLHVVHTMTLMSVGLYTTPRGAYLPSLQF